MLDTRETRETDVPETDRSAPSGLLRLRSGIGVLLATIVALQPAASGFFYDAGGYWNLAKGLVSGSVPVNGETLALRGVLTGLLYVPAALVTQIAGNSLAGPAVLAENAVLIGLIGVVVVPQLVGLWRPVTPAVLVVSALGTGVALAGFAPFPLTDLWAAVLLIVTVVLLKRRSMRWLFLAGLAAGAAFNIRPAVLVPVAGIALAVLVARRWSAAWFLLGSAAALAPQILVNRWRGGTWAPWPEMTGYLTKLQSSYAAYVVRYDTVFDGSVSDGPAAEPRRFFCSPSMADALGSRSPSSPGELLSAFLGHLPTAVVFSAQKVAAALHWPLSTPYTAPAPAVNALFAVIITAVAVVGAAVLFRESLRWGRSATLAQVTAGIAWIGSVATLVTAATEARFALPLLLFGLGGCAAVARGGLPLSGRAPRAWIAGTLVAVVAVFGIGHLGLGHPVEGDVTAAICADS